MLRTFKTALIQMLVGADKLGNLEHATKLISSAKQHGAKLIALPEYFNARFGPNFFEKNAEPIPNGTTCQMLSEVAKENAVYLVGGTVPEVDNNKHYNTCTVWNPEGEMIAKYRKLHLFDVDIPGKITLRESDISDPGNELVTFDFEGVKIGLGICYDLRFEELAKLYRLQGCKMLIYPAAFNLTTGPIHFEPLQRGRALDNQVFVYAVSPARGDKGYIAWGYSQVTNPWGKIIAQASEKEEIILADIDLSECDEVREQIPIFDQRRTDLYDTVMKT